MCVVSAKRVVKDTDSPHPVTHIVLHLSDITPTQQSERRESACNIYIGLSAAEITD